MDKWLKKENLIMMVLAGILLVIIVLPTKETRENFSVNVQQPQTKTEENTTEQEDYSVYLERKLERILSKIKGVGTVYVMVTLQETDVEGVLVVAGGAGSGRVSQDITEAVQALFEIELHKIKVVGCDN